MIVRCLAAVVVIVCCLAVVVSLGVDDYWNNGVTASIDRWVTAVTPDIGGIFLKHISGLSRPSPPIIITFLLPVAEKDHGECYQGRLPT